MSIVGRARAARYRIEDGLGAMTARAAGILKVLAPSFATSIDTFRMYEAPTRGVPQILKAYAGSPWLQASTKKIGQRFAAVEWQIFVQVGSSGKAMSLSDPRSITRTIQRSYMDERQRLLTDLKQAGRLRQIHRHPMLEMLSYGNPLMTGYAGRMLTQIHRDIAGEAFWALSSNLAGKPAEFWPMPPPWVVELPTVKKPFYKIVVNGQTHDLPAEDVVWFREPNPATPYGRGTGQAMSLGDELETDEYAARFTKNFFLNRAKPELMVFAEGMDEDLLRSSKLVFEQQHRGYQRAHRSWWYNHKIEVKELTQKLVDLGINGLRTYERDMVLQSFGLPPEEMGIVTNSNRATAHESKTTMAVSVLVPRLDSMREQLQDEVAPRYDPRIILSYVSPVPEDRDFRLAAVKAAPWASTRGEIRKLQGQQDRGRGDDVHLQQLNLIEVPAPTPDRAKALPPAEKKSKDLTTQGITVVLDALRPERIKVEIEPVWSEEMQAWGDAALAELGLDVSFNMLNPLVEDQIQLVVGEHIDWVDDTTRDQLRIEMTEGVQEGEGYDDLTERVKKVFNDLKTWRAERIARTEVVQSASLASEQAWIQSGIVWGSEWLTTPGSERHGAAGYGGTVKPLGVLEFQFDDGNTALYPGGFGEASEDIHCMCATIPVLEDPDKSTERQDANWREVNARRLVWQRIARAAYRRGFRNQEKDVLEMLRNVST